MKKEKFKLEFNLMACAEGGLHLTAPNMDFGIYLKSSDISKITEVLQPALSLHTLSLYGYGIRQVLASFDDFEPGNPEGQKIMATIIPN